MIVPFKKSRNLSIGMELELQLIDPHTLDLATTAKDLFRKIQKSRYCDFIKPELTQSMIEVNSSKHYNLHEMLNELYEICYFLTLQSQEVNTFISGGGTHPFQNWSSRKIFPTSRFRNVSRIYGYLAKRFTVFALHIHIGCSSQETALYLTHMLSRYIPQLIALSASSPFYQGVTTDYHSTRTSVVNGFPLSGVMPFVTNWKAFSAYYHKMLNLNIVSSMKDFYWDVRPKPEFGTVEIRICDMPLTLERTAAIGAFVQTLARYIIKEKPQKIHEDLYLAYSYNRFQASRFGYDGDFVEPFTHEHLTIQEDLHRTLKKVAVHAEDLGNMYYLRKVEQWVIQKKNDAKKLKQIYQRVGTLEGVVREQCRIWGASTLKRAKDKKN